MPSQPHTGVGSAGQKTGLGSQTPLTAVQSVLAHSQDTGQSALLKQLVPAPPAPAPPATGAAPAVPPRTSADTPPVPLDAPPAPLELPPAVSVLPPGGMDQTTTSSGAHESAPAPSRTRAAPNLTGCLLRSSNQHRSPASTRHRGSR